MEKIPNAVYTKELREEAVRMITEGGMTLSEVARILSIPKSTITYWIRAEKKGKLSGIGSPKKPLSETEMETCSGKKASSYFAKESHPGTSKRLCYTIVNIVLFCPFFIGIKCPFFIVCYITHWSHPL